MIPLDSAMIGGGGLPAAMKLGLCSINTHACSFPDGVARIARVAEDSGYESLWAGEHIVLPDPQRPPSPMAPGDRMLDSLTTLTFAAALTTTIRLATGIVILPQRNPVVLAKELASLDVLSGGRLIVGIGAGYLEPEMTAIGVAMRHRGERTDEYIEAMRALWSMEKPSYSGQYVAFSGVDAHPRPVQRPAPPIVVGGQSAAAHERAVRYGHGWYGFFMTPEQAAQQLEALRRAATYIERPADLPPVLEISITPRGRITPGLVESYAALGVHRLVVMPPPKLSLDDLVSFVRSTAAFVSPN
jgi:probable F420-dependent oxidoreductase